MRLMMICTILIVTQVALILGESIDLQRCKSAIDGFSDCMRPNIQFKREGRKEESTPLFRKSVSSCFQRNGCSLMNANQIPNDVSTASQQRVATFNAWWDRVPKDQQNCIMDAVKDAFVSSLNTCIAKDLPGYTLPVPQEKPKSGKGTHDDKTKSARLKDQMEASMKPCPKRTDVGKCIEDLRKPFNKKSCDLRSTCEAKIASANCKATSDRLKSVACECIKQNKQSIRAKFNGFKTAEALGPFAIFSGKENYDMKQKVDSCQVKVPPNVVSAGGDLPDELLEKAGKYVDNMAQREVGFCKGCDN